MARKEKEVINNLPACVQNTNLVDFSDKPGNKALVDFTKIDTIQNVRNSHVLCNEYAPDLIRSCIASLKGHGEPIDMAQWPVMKEILDRGIGKVAQGIFVEKREEMKLLESPEAKWAFLENKAEELLDLWYDKGILQAHIKKREKVK